MSRKPRRLLPPLMRDQAIRRESLQVKESAIVYLFPYPGNGTAVAMKGAMPNRWFRWWHWALLGWRWSTAKEEGVK